MRRVCADLFPREHRRDPRHAGQLGKSRSAAGIPWSAPEVSERTSWTVQATESSSSVGRAQEDSTQRRYEAVHGKRLRKRHRLGTEQSRTHLHREFVYSKVDAVTVCQAECYLMVLRVT